MKTFNLLSLYFLLFTGLKCYSQEGSLSYDLLEDDPLTANNIGLSLNPLSYDGSRDDYLVIGGELGTLYWTEKFMLQGSFFLGYLDRIQEKVFISERPEGHVVEGLPVGGSAPTNKWNIEGTYFFASNSVKTKESRVSLSRSRQVESYSMIPLKKLVLFGGNFGIGGFAGQYDLAGSNSVVAEHIETDQFLNLETENIESYNYSRKKFNYVKFGLSRTVIKNFSGDFESFGKISLKKLSSVYCNMLIGFAPSLNDIVKQDYKVEGPESDIVIFDNQYNLDKNTPFNPLGFEVGYQEKSLKGLGFTYNVAVGFRPGYHSTRANFFGVIGTNIFLSTRK